MKTPKICKPSQKAIKSLDTRRVKIFETSHSIKGISIIKITKPGINKRIPLGPGVHHPTVTITKSPTIIKIILVKILTIFHFQNHFNIGSACFQNRFSTFIAFIFKEHTKAYLDSLHKSDKKANKKTLFQCS